MNINNANDLRIAYELVKKMTPYIPQSDDPKKAARAIGDMKRAIRAYNRKEAEKPFRRLVKDEGVDGYVELMELPETEDPEKWFDWNERLSCRSAYDCTGQAFTRWHYIFRRRGKLMCYHAVGYDV